jgi:hypothetical protein
MQFNRCLNIINVSRALHFTEFIKYDSFKYLNMDPTLVNRSESSVDLFIDLFNL